MALGCGLTSVRGNRGENYENEPLVCQKHIKKNKNSLTLAIAVWLRLAFHGKRSSTELPLRWFHLKALLHQAGDQKLIAY
jgi:hypothetical protein